MSTVEERAELAYRHLRDHLGQRFTLAELCQATGLQPGAKTQAAIRAARDMATRDGLHFPPAIAATGYTYTVTDVAMDALDPSLHMRRIEAGVRARAEDGEEFMRREARQLPRELRSVLKQQRQARQGLAQAQRAMDDMVIELVKLRREERQREADGQPA